MTELSKAFALAVPHEEALKIRDDVGFFQAIRSVLVKGSLAVVDPRRRWNLRFSRSSPAPSPRTR